MARNLCILCGKAELPWNLMCQLYPAILKETGELALSSHENNIEPLRRLNSVRIGWKNLNGYAQLEPISASRFTTHSLVWQFCNSRATDPRDKIYSLLGLATDSASVVPDYSTSASKLYTHWADTLLGGDPYRQKIVGSRIRTLGFLDNCLPSTP